MIYTFPNESHVIKCIKKFLWPLYIAIFIGIPSNILENALQNLFLLYNNIYYYVNAIKYYPSSLNFKHITGHVIIL